MTEVTILVDDCLCSLFTVSPKNATHFNVRNLETGELSHTIEAGKTLLSRKHALQTLKMILNSGKPTKQH